MNNKLAKRIRREQSRNRAQVKKEVLNYVQHRMNFTPDEIIEMFQNNCTRWERIKFGLWLMLGR